MDERTPTLVALSDPLETGIEPSSGYPRKMPSRRNAAE